MKRACDEWQAVRKGGLAKRVIAALVAVAMLGGLGYATASTAVAQDDTTQQQAQQTEQSAKTTSESQDEKTSDSEATSKKAAADETSADGSAEDTNTTDADAGVEAQNGADETAVQAANEPAATSVADGGSPESGSLLLDESFKNSTFGDANWTTADSACLTAATSGSLKCENTQDSSDIQGENGKGYLQLTDNSENQKAAVLYNQPVISKSGLHVTFDYYMYQTSGAGKYTTPADGISFFLTDGAATLSKAGTSGAALGYATSDDDGIGGSKRGEGVAQGVLGIGFDRFGNFSQQNATGTKSDKGYARVTGGEDCGQWSDPKGANSVTVRGAGKTDSDGNWNNGYCIVASENVAAGLDSGKATKSEDDTNGKSVDITIDPVADDSATTQHLTVKIAGETVLEKDIDRLPDSVKFGFSASTGADHQVQLIRGLKVYSVNKLSQLDLVKSVDKDQYPDADSHTFNVGDEVPYTFVVRNSGTTTLNNVMVNDPNITNVSCGTDTLAANQQTTCSGALTLTEDMVGSEGHFTNTATASGTDDEGNAVNSPQASVTIKAIKPLGAPEKHKRIKKNSDNTYTVNVDVIGATNSTTITSTRPVDFTLVLDVSGSMEDQISSADSTVKLDALKAAVSNFLDEVAEINKGAQSGSEPVRVGLVKFAGKTTDNIGNQTYWERGNTYNRSQIVKKLTADTDGLKSEVNALTAGGATRADYGFQHAFTVMSKARTEAKKVVIFFTDGKPTSQSTFDDGVANDAVKYAKKLKNSGDTVYSIGVFDGANPASTATSENKFMHAVSSNYPNAANYTDLSDGSNAGYYKTATDASDLNSIFEEIRKSETTTYGFTNVSIEDTLSGYVELSDKNYAVTAKGANGNEVTLEEGKDYTLTYDESAKKFTVVFQNMLQDGVTYTLSYNVKPTQEAYDEYAANGYGGTVGDADTDLDGSTTSSGQLGFHSNESACLAYTANGKGHVCSDNPYPHPVIQVVSSTLHIEKQWSGDGEKPASINVTIKQGNSDYKTVTLTPDDNGNWSTDMIIPAGESKTYTVTENDPGNQWNVSYQHKVGDGNLADGNAVTVPQSATSQTATVIVTNKQALVTLPAGSITVNKKVVGTNTGHDFSFTMIATGDNAGKVTWPRTDQSKSKVTISQVSQTQVKSATFGDELTFPAANATYTFQVTEDKPTDTTGWKYDDSEQTVTVTVSYDEAQKKWTAVASPAEVTFTNRYIAVASLPLTGGTTDRQWLLIGGGIAGMEMLMIGAAGIWRGRKRLV